VRRRCTDGISENGIKAFEMLIGNTSHIYIGEESHLLAMLMLQK
jgi:hypothetical protein